ncbi:MAG: formylglycine-generating enzyme family protein [Candidatus Methanoperedens sp.]
MPDIEIKRGYEVLPDNNVRFGVRVINNSDSAISDVEVILDYTESLFEIEGDKIQKLGNIPPTVPRTAKFILKPLGCIHKEEIGATVRYKDHQWKKHVEQMRPKEVHCVCPFLKEKPITRADFLRLSNSGYLEERGVNFEGVSVAKLVDFIAHTCKNRLYKVDEFPIENGKILYLAGDAVGEKAYYLLTAVVKEYEGLTQVLLRAGSDKSHGLSGFLNETLDNLRHLVVSASAREIGIIKKEQVINIIDSVVQRSTISMEEGAPSVKIRDSMVQRTDIKGDVEKKRGEEERLRKEREEQERLRRQREQEERALGEKKAREDAERRESERLKARQEEERIAKEREKLSVTEKKEGISQIKFFAVALVLGVVLIGYWVLAPGVTKSTPFPFPDPPAGQKTFTNSIGAEFVLIPAGEFNMGSPANEANRGSDEGPVHRVKISNAFYIGKYEVTQREWKEVMGNNPSYFKGDDLPVETVSWNDVQEFIKKLNEKEGSNKYRLPSEAEWEYAARAGTTTSSSFGDGISKLNDYAWNHANSGDKTHDVGQKKPNPWGLYDIHGNVWEWVQDVYQNSYSGAPIDGSAWEGSGSARVVRGGSWRYFRIAWDYRSALRSDNDPDDRYTFIGFRLVRVS